MDFYAQIIRNIKDILKKKDIKQSVAADYMDVDPSQFSRILSQSGVTMSLRQLSTFAQNIGMREIDIITWPDVYLCPEKDEKAGTEVLLQMRLTKEKKDQVMKVIFGENNIEILNK